MTDPQGGFYSSEDADSEGVEGRFYVWTPAELQLVLGADAAKVFGVVYNVTDGGNFEGASILNRPKGLAECAERLGQDEQELVERLAACRAKLLAARAHRVRPARDDKVLVNWNGLMIDAMARAATTFDEPRYLNAARRAAHFLLENLRDDRGRLLHVWRRGRSSVPALLDDYCCLIEGLVSLYQADFDEGLLDEASRLADDVLEHFPDPEAQGFFTTAKDHPRLITRPKEIVDSSVPSGNAMAATALLRLGRLCGVTRYTEAAEGVIAGAREQLEQFPTAMAQMLLAVDALAGPAPQIVVVGDWQDRAVASLLTALEQHFLPRKLVAVRPATDGATGPRRPLDALFRGKRSVDGKPTVYVCDDFTCQEPVTGSAAILELWQRLAEPGCS
ncbi:MAG: thioredoxin domain-containing protein, partial [Pirellulales bacterium]